MKRDLLYRVFGVFLAGVLLVESSMPVFATEINEENQTQVQIIQETEGEQIQATDTVEEQDEVQNMEETSAVEESEEETSSVVESIENDSTQEESTEVLESESMGESVQETSEIVETQTEEITMTEEELLIDGSAIEIPAEEIQLSVEDEETTTIIPVSGIEIETEVELVKGAINLSLDESTKASAAVIAKVYPANATNQEITWTSSNTAVVTVDENGVMKPVSVGKANVIATASNGVTAKIAVVVVAGSGKLRLKSSDNVTLYCNEDLSGIANADKTHQIELKTEMDCEYRSSNEKVATVDSQGLVKACSPGTAVISVIGKSNGAIVSVKVTVKRMAESIELPAFSTKETTEITVLKGTAPEIAFQVFPQDASTDIFNAIAVETQDDDLITIDKNWTKGKSNGSFRFTADELGYATITITAGDTYYDEDNDPIPVKVGKKIIVHIVDEKSTKVASSIQASGLGKMQSGTSQTLNLTIKDKSGEELILSKVPIGYVSSNTEIATVDANGTITAHKGGKAVITVYVMNGSNVKTNFSITVEQRPEEIVFDRQVYGVSKAANATASVTVQPRFVPTTTANKNVTWNVAGVYNAEGQPIEGKASDYFIVDTRGRVTIKRPATDGMKAAITCTSKAYSADENQVVGTVWVEVQEKKVSSVKFAKATVEAVGLTEHNLSFITSMVKGYTSLGDEDYSAYTSDAEIATAKVENGQVVLSAHKYGTVTVTLCADQAVTATCKVTIYPTARGALAAKEASYLLQQAQYNAKDKVQLVIVDSKTKKNIIDPTLFRYESSNPDVVYVDENGIVYANPKATITSKNNQVTITATLKDDPDKRTVKTKVVVCTTEQIAYFHVTYYETTDKALQDSKNTGGTSLTDSGAGMVYSNAGQKFVLRVTAYGENNDVIANPQIAITSSDSNLAEVTSVKALASNKNVMEVVITVKKAGRFSINFVAKDQMKASRGINFVAYSAKPILASKDLGTINRNAQVVTIDGTKAIESNQSFVLLGADGTEIKDVSVEYVIDKKTSKKIENKIAASGRNRFEIEKLGNDAYRLVMAAGVMSGFADGTYVAVLKVERTQLGFTEDGEGFPTDETISETVEASFNITSTLPKLKAAQITLNTFIKGDEVKIPINTTEVVENVTVDDNKILYEEIDVYKKDDGYWYAKLKDEVFDNWKKSSTSGTLLVELEGYEKTVEMKLTVTCKATKPVVKQAEIPSVQLQHGAETYITLVDAKNQTWDDYTIVRKNASTAPVFNVESQADGRTKVTFVDANMKLKSQGATYKETVLVSKEGWRSPIELTLSVKTYNGNSIPIVKFGKATININKAVDETYAETQVIVSHSNVALTEGEWTISNNCTYRTRENNKTVTKLCSEAFKAEYENGILKISLRDENVPNGTYRLTMTNLWDSAYDAGLKKPLTTAVLTVVVSEKTPVVNIKMSGKLDLIKRSISTLQGTVSVSNMNSTVSKICLGDDLSDKFYCIRKDNTFTIYARSYAVLTTSKVTGTVEITMSDGTVLAKAISFTPTQSIPSVITPTNKTIYKSTDTKTVDFNFNEKLTDGVRISDIKAVSVPSGFQVQDNNGHLYVTLTNKALKQGKYTIVVNVYFKGAQAISGDTQGKAVKKTIYVEVKE